MNCPKCKSENIQPTGLCIHTHPAYYKYKCEDCGYEFEVQEEVSEMKLIEITIEITPQGDGTVPANYIPFTFDHYQ